MSAQAYIGNELEIFARAINWKRYFSRKIRPLIGERVLEVGAGLGETTRYLCARRHEKWLCLEPDAGFCDKIREKLSAGGLPACCSVQIGTTESLEGEREFDTILYIDVLEHIEDDRSELRRVSSLLKDGGRAIILAPAHDFLFSPFDLRIGHVRRYDKKSIRNACPEKLTVEHTEYLDSVGMLASLANRRMLGQSTPSSRQLLLWDRVMISMSRILDPVFSHRLGKSILAVLKKGAVWPNQTSAMRRK